MRHRIGFASKVKRRKVIGVPSIALQKTGNAWFVVENNHVKPNGFFVLSGKALIIDETVPTGLSITFAGKIIVST